MSVQRVMEDRVALRVVREEPVHRVEVPTLRPQLRVVRAGESVDPHAPVVPRVARSRVSRAAASASRSRRPAPARASVKVSSPVVWTAGMKIAVGLLAALAAVVIAAVIGTALLPTELQTVVVQSGDTLTSVAQSLEGAPSVDVAVRDIAQLNGLGGDSIAAGQVLRVPSY